MKNVVFLVLAACVFGLAALKSPAGKYVCLPCGRECDSATFDKGGNCPVCMMELVDKENVRFKNISFDQLCARLKANKDIVLLDVRSKDEFNNTMEKGNAFGRFKKAININVTELEKRYPELNAYKNKEVVVYCSHSHRSPEASYFLSTHGFKNVTNVVGGVSVLGPGKTRDCLKGEFVVYEGK